jgi:hypothetical protein
MDDIVQRLRGGVYGINRIQLCLEAADEIEHLRRLMDGMVWVHRDEPVIVYEPPAPLQWETT